MNMLLENIKPNDYNPNEMSEEEFKELVDEVKHLGKLPKPIILRKKGDSNYEIVDGEHSYKALLQLGYSELEEGMFEVVEIDDLEAMRQTYKRNLGGENNPVKLGKMFEKALHETKVSNRELAEQWGISEATIRNYLAYAEASRLRNGFAIIEKLKLKQIKRYLEIAKYAPSIANYWMNCGSLDDALIWFSDEKFNYDNKYLMKKVADTFTKIVTLGSDNFLPHNEDPDLPEMTKEVRGKYMAKFKNGIRKAYKLATLRKRMERHFDLGENSNLIVTQYLDLYFNSPASLIFPQYKVDQIFSLAIAKKGDKLSYILTVQELAECLRLEQKEDSQEVINKIKILIAKKLKIAPSTVGDGDYGGIEAEMDELEIEHGAPEYAKNNKPPMPRKFILGFMEIKFENEDIREAYWHKLATAYSKGTDFNNVDEGNPYAYRDRMREVMEHEDQLDKVKSEFESIAQKSEQELAILFIEKVEDMIKGDETAKKNTIEKLSSFPKDLLLLFVQLASKHYDEVQRHLEWRRLVNEGLSLRKG